MIHTEEIIVVHEITVLSKIKPYEYFIKHTRRYAHKRAYPMPGITDKWEQRSRESAEVLSLVPKYTRGIKARSNHSHRRYDKLPNTHVSKGMVQS